MNPTVDNDLQKAIDDITKNTNDDPVFSDPVAAPSSIPEGDTGTIADPIGPFQDIRPATDAPGFAPAPAPNIPAPAPETFSMPNPTAAQAAPTPGAPVAADIPAEAPLEAAPVQDTPADTVQGAVTFTAETISEPAPVTDPIATPAPEATSAPTPEAITTPEAIPATEAISTTEATLTTDTASIKEAALRDLAPLVDKLDVDASRKFNLYKDIREELHDDSIIPAAYDSAKNILDDQARAEALLYLVESI